jgi:hypothetical protein
MPDVSKQELKDKVDGVQRHIEGRPLPFRIAWVVAGVIVLLAGLAMTALPGPAIVVIPTGLAMIAVEFAWARKLLHKGIDVGYAAAETLERMDTYKKVMAAIAVLCAIAAVVSFVLLR